MTLLVKFGYFHVISVLLQACSYLSYEIAKYVYKIFFINIYMGRKSSS